MAIHSRPAAPREPHRQTLRSFSELVRMKCPVCSYDNRPPGSNCTRCGARMPSAPGALKGATRRAEPAYLADRSRRGPTIALIVVTLLGALALGTTWFAFREPLTALIAMSGRSATPSPEVPRAPASPVAVQSAFTASEVTSDTTRPSPGQTTAADEPSTAAMPANSAREVNGLVEPAVVESPKPPLKPRRTTAPKASQVAEPAPAEPEPASATPPPPPPAPPPRPVDRWQQMASDIVNCPHENVFSRALCEQRVRLRYCEGYWGGAPECPSGRQADQGQ